MGLAYAELELSNPRLPALEALSVTALADTGSDMLCIPLRLAAKLQLEAAEHRKVTLADGRKATVPYVGPIKVRFGERLCFVGAYAMGDEVILGAIAMEDMDLVVSPATRSVTVNPLHPDGPQHRA